MYYGKFKSSIKIVYPSFNFYIDRFMAIFVKIYILLASYYFWSIFQTLYYFVYKYFNIYVSNV